MKQPFKWQMRQLWFKVFSPDELTKLPACYFLSLWSRYCFCRLQSHFKDILNLLIYSCFRVLDLLACSVVLDLNYCREGGNRVHTTLSWAWWQQMLAQGTDQPSSAHSRSSYLCGYSECYWNLMIAERVEQIICVIWWCFKMQLVSWAFLSRGERRAKACCPCYYYLV